MSEPANEPGTAHGLLWNIKDSFREYVAELPDGAETWTGEAGGIAADGLVFAPAGVEIDPESGEPTVLKFTGGVRYVGYRGMLRVDIADPWLEVAPEGASLTANTAPSGVTPRRTTIAKVPGRPVRASDGAWEWRADSTALSASGATLLGSVYQPGTPAAGFHLRTAGS